MQIVHSLRTSGDLSFEEISLVVPFIEMGYDYGIQDLDAPQPGSFRAFKSHAPRQFSPLVEGAKCIYMARNPLNVRSTAFTRFETFF